MSALMKNVGKYTAVFCDESFSGTNASEAAAIASQVIKAMSAKGCRGIFITHIHELTSLPEKINADRVCVSRLDNLTVEVDTQTGKRLYRIQRRCFAKNSRAEDIAGRYGLDFESLMK